MRRLLVGVFVALTLLVPVLRAVEPRKNDQAAAQPKAPAEQFRELSKAFQDQMSNLLQKFQTATTEEEKNKIRDLALQEIPAEYGQKLLALATAHPKDPIAVEVLVWICTQVPQAPQVPQALDVLLRDHGDNDRLAMVCQALASRDDGASLLRTVRAKNSHPLVRLLAGFFLADALNEQDEPTAAQDREAETLLVEFLERSKDLDTIPHPMVKAAESTLWEVRNLRVGKTAPDTESADLNDKAVKLSDYKGKVVVLDFWATWCLPCRGMIPHERELVKRHVGKPFVFISVSADEKKETLQEFIAKEPMPWAHWWSGAQGGIIEKWNIRAFPTLYVIDARGVIRAKMIGGGSDTEKKLDALIEKLVQEAS